MQLATRTKCAQNATTTTWLASTINSTATGIRSFTTDNDFRVPSWYKSTGCTLRSPGTLHSFVRIFCEQPCANGVTGQALSLFQRFDLQRLRNLRRASVRKSAVFEDGEEPEPRVHGCAPDTEMLRKIILFQSSTTYIEYYTVQLTGFL